MTIRIQEKQKNNTILDNFIQTRIQKFWLIIYLIIDMKHLIRISLICIQISIKKMQML